MCAGESIDALLATIALWYSTGILTVFIIVAACLLCDSSRGVGPRDLAKTRTAILVVVTFNRSVAKVHGRVASSLVEG